MYSQMWIVLCIFWKIHLSWASYPTYETSTRLNPSFLPSKSGETPSCVTDPRLTYCIEPKKYPKDRILYLLKNKMFDVDTFLQDETRDTYTFEARDGMIIPSTMMYPPRMPTGYPTPTKGYNQPKPTPSSYLPPRQNITYSSYGQRTVPSYNSFTSSYPSKFDSYATEPADHSYHNSRSTSSHYDDDPYPRYMKNGYPTPSSPPNPQQYWWKKMSRRHKRQTSLEDLCPSRANYIMPRAAQSVGGDWMFLVNVNEQYTQLVKSEICIRNTCEGSCDTPEGFSAICQQQYVQKRLVALDGSGSKLNSDTFWFPSCCVCKIRPA